MDSRIVSAEPAHLEEVAKNISLDDADELRDGYDMEPIDVIKTSYLISVKCWAAVVDGVTIAVFGVTDNGASGRPWMVGTVNLDHHRLKFLKGCRAVIAEMLVLFPVLENVVDCRNNHAIRWLHWLGFEFREVVPVGKQGLPFITFRMVRP